MNAAAGFAAACVWSIMVLSAWTATAVSVDLPYAVHSEKQAQLFALTAGEQDFGKAALSWSENSLILEVTVKDETPVSLADAGVGITEAYRADSVEFWINRHQFVAVETSAGGGLWDYLYDMQIEKAKVTRQTIPGGYRMRVEAPWAALGLAPSSGMNFQFAMQINDRQRLKTDKGWKDSVRQTLFPVGAVWDRPSTYGTVFLASTDPGKTSAAAPAPFAALEIRTYAYRRAADAVVKRLPPFVDSAIRLVCRRADGTVMSDNPVPSGAGTMLMELAWDEKNSGMFTAELWLVSGEKRFGPVSEPYFCSGAATIAEYRSNRKAPADLASFWQKKLAAMREVPMQAEVETMPSARPDVIVEKIKLRNHRGNPMQVIVTRKKSDEGKRAAHLNVYPPMRDDKPEWPRQGSLGLTFCGSLQGACRLPGQEHDEELWANSENLDECYWLDVVLDGVRAMDYVATRSDSNGQIVVSGGSRGGWYTLALAAVAPDRVALARFTSPCYSDVTMNRQLGYGSAATEIYKRFECDRVKTGGRVFANFQYFDPLFLAEMIRTPVVFSAGLQDNICSAIGMTAAANRMPKEFCTFILDSEGHHGGSPWMGPIIRSAEQGVMKHK
jgi:cephalosporin-C deacetylase-like acetyl esterase